MNRRQYLAASLSVPLLSGCLDTQTDDGDGTDTETAISTTTSEDGSSAPDGIYVQPFVENMLTAGTASSGEYEFGVFYTFPHQFWTVTGTDRSEQPLRDVHTLHLMASVWDPETGTVLPETGLSVEITHDDDLVSEEVIYPMFSQRMGFHYGANFTLEGDGTYTVTVSVGGTDLRRTGTFEDRFEDPASAAVDFEFSQDQRDQLTTQDIESGGEPGAVEPMEMGTLPVGRAEAAEELPGTVRGSATADGVTYVVTSLADERFGDGTYVAVSARTRYNALLVPAMGLSGTLTRNGETVYDGPFERTLDPELDYHYGALVDGVSSGDELALSVDTPPQVARHRGYETAFLDTPTVNLTL
jgi:hypothetical protein